MKVLLAITKSNFGGAQRYVFEVAKGAKRAGHEVVVLCGKEGPLVEKLRAEGIRTISLPHLGRDVSVVSDARSFFELYKILKTEKPDVLHLNSSKMGGMGAVAGRLAKVPKIIFTLHGFPWREQRPWWQKGVIKVGIWGIILLSHKTICVSEDGKRAMSWWPFVKNKLVVIHNGLETFPLGPRRENIFTVGTLSELHHTKGLDILLRGFAEVFKDKPARLIVIGEGEKKKELKDLAQDLGIMNQTYFSGFVPEAREQLSNFDIFTLTSRTEGLPYVLLEAGIASLPVVASRVGGIPEVIKNDETGLLFKKEKVEELAQALEKLFKDPVLRRKLGGNLHDFVLKNFSQQEMLEKTLSLY